MNIIVNHIRKAGLLMAALLMTAALFAQDRIVVKGVVSDENGQPLIGAGVMEKGTTNGAVTDIDGNRLSSICSFSRTIPSSMKWW